MTGLLVLALVASWIWAVFKASHWIGRQVKSGRWRWPIAVIVFLGLLPLPVIDELIAGPQVKTLCRDGAVYKIDEQRIKGRRVKSSSEPLNERVPGIAIPVTYTRSVYRDESTGEELASRSSYVVKGGALVRTLAMSESTSPMFVRSHCAPAENVYDDAKRLSFEIVKQLK